MSKKIVIFLFFLLFLSLNLKSQRWQVAHQNFDSILFSPSQILITKDTVYTTSKDTIVVLKHNSKFKIRKNPYYKSAVFYDSLETKWSEKGSTKELYKLIFKTAPPEVHDSSNFDKSHTLYEQFSGRKIRNIYIKKADIIEGSVHDTNIIATSLLAKKANNIHCNTRDFIIENNLTFKKGDIIDPYQIANNERLLRNKSYIEDAHIVLIPLINNSNQVDVLVLTKDAFSIGASLNYTSMDNFKLSVFDKNVLGFGVRLEPGLVYRNGHEPKYGPNITYVHDNISNTFIGAKVEYENSWKKELLLLNLERKFISFETKYAGAILLYELADERELKLEDSTYITPFKVRVQDYWLGRSFKLSSAKQLSLNVSFRYSLADFVEHPYIDVDTNRFYHDRTFWIGEFSLINHKFYKSSRVLGFGVTEDIPYGFKLKLNMGFTQTQFEQMPYTGIGFAYGKFFKWPGYLFSSIEFGGFLKNKTFQDAVLNFRLINVGDLHQFGRYSARNFFEINYQAGINQGDPGNETRINSGWGKQLSGIDTDDFWGNEKLSVNFETVLFTPWFFYGFKFASFAFLEMGWVSEEKLFLQNPTFFSSVGLGFRIKNESWIFNTFNIGFAYFLGSPKGIGPFAYILNESDPRIFNKLNPGKPRVIRMDKSPLYYFE